MLAGLHVNATYGQEDIESLPKSDRSTLLHAAAALNAEQCAQVEPDSSVESHTQNDGPQLLTFLVIDCTL